MIKSNIYLFYGEDSAAIRAKLKQWTDKLSKQTDLLLDSIDLDASEVTFDQIQNAVSLVPLFSGKRLVVVRNVFSAPKNVAEKMTAYLPSVPESTVLVLVEEGKIDPKDALLNQLKNNYKVDYFAPVSLASINKSATLIIQKSDIKINFAAKNLLLNRIGLDSFRLANELEKLRLYANSKEITTEMVETLVPETLESRIFQLSDAIMGNQVKTACSLMLNELRFGADPLKILGLLISLVRKQLIVSDNAPGKMSDAQISVKMNIKPFVIQKMKATAQKTGQVKLINYYTRLCLADINLKLGLEAEPVMLNLCRI
ncbi:MAG: DNA polymerase III subunit delta [Patescibacteria group bacterium]|jgi:DNA polymerase-3 subunit delta